MRCNHKLRRIYSSFEPNLHHQPPCRRDRPPPRTARKRGRASCRSSGFLSTRRSPPGEVVWQTLACSTLNRTADAPSTAGSAALIRRQVSEETRIGAGTNTAKATALFNLSLWNACKRERREVSSLLSAAQSSKVVRLIF